MSVDITVRSEGTFEYILEYLARYIGSGRHTDGYAHYGYDFWLPSLMLTYLREVHHLQQWEAEPLKDQFSPAFLDSAWQLCRMGVLRPGIKKTGEQAVGSADGFSLTEEGRRWIQGGVLKPFVPVEPNVFAKLIGNYERKFGKGFNQRAQEAFRCRSVGAYLATCSMCGAAAESIILALAIAKTGNEEKVLAEYRSASGRSRVINTIIGQAKGHIRQNFDIATNLLKYWRDEASHGEFSEISEFEANSAVMGLLHFAQFVEVKWEELSRP